MKQKAKNNTRHLDWATIFGLIVASCSILIGLALEGGRLSDLAKISSFGIVLGGTLGALFVTTPSHVLIEAFNRIPDVLWEPHFVANETIADIIKLAGRARNTGLLSIESDVRAIEDPFLRKALLLGVEDANIEFWRSTMEAEISLIQERGEAVAAVFENAGEIAPTMGILGSVMGLMQVMKGIDLSNNVGPEICIALVATIYGILLANFLFIPVAKKLRARLSDDLLLKRLSLEGAETVRLQVSSFHIEDKLETYRCPIRDALAVSSPHVARDLRKAS